MEDEQRRPRRLEQHFDEQRCARVERHLQRFEPRSIGRSDRAHALRRSELEGPEHHFRRRRLAESDRLRRIGIVLVRGRIVVVRDDVEARAARQRHRRFGAVEQLPVEIVGGYVQQRLLPPARIRGRHAHVLAAQMHVREERHDLDVLVGDPGAAHFVIRRVRRNGEEDVARRGCADFFLELAAAEVKSDPRPIGLWLAVRMVVQVGPDHLPSAHPPARAFRINRRLCPDRPYAEHVELRWARQGIEADREQDGVVRYFARARANLDRADPVVFLQIERQVRCRKEIVALSGDVHLRQLDDVVGLAKLPAIGEMRRRRQIL